MTPGEASDDALRLSRAYRSNLTALALVALFTGGFFVYSTQSLATLRRRREFAVLHALGVTRGQQLAARCSRAARSSGRVGALLGIVLGIVAARDRARRARRAISAPATFAALAAELDVQRLGDRWRSACSACVRRDRRRAAPCARSCARADGERAEGRRRRRAASCARTAASSLALLLLAAVAVAAAADRRLAAAGLSSSIALLIVGAVIAMPSIVRIVLRHAPFARAMPYQIAIAQIAGTARYATLSVSAIVVSFSLMVAMAIMVTSFRTSLDAWTQSMLPADLYVRARLRRPVGASRRAHGASASAHLPGVARFETQSLRARAAGCERAAGDADRAHARITTPIADALWMTDTAEVAAAHRRDAGLDHRSRGRSAIGIRAGRRRSSCPLAGKRLDGVRCAASGATTSIRTAPS